MKVDNAHIRQKRLSISQQVELMILKGLLVDTCEANNILVLAVPRDYALLRHKGFIPLGTMILMFVFPEDFNKLLDIYDKECQKSIRS